MGSLLRTSILDHPRIFKTSSSNVIMMKLFIFALVCIAAASAGDCDEPRPEYCARNVHLCKVLGFIDFMKKMCPRHCGYCNLEESNDFAKECLDIQHSCLDAASSSWRRLNAGCNS